MIIQILNFLKLLFYFNVSIFFFSFDQDQNVSQTFESKPVASYDHEVITAWNDVLLEIEKNAEGLTTSMKKKLVTIFE